MRTAAGIAVLASGVLAASAGAQTNEHSFTLAQAHRAAERAEIAGESVSACHWASSRVADCGGTFHGVIVNGAKPSTLRFTFVVERDGACRLKLTRPGIASGVIGDPRKWQGCNTGPLVVSETHLRQEA